MKQALTLSLLAAASSVSMAQAPASNVTVYGIMDAGLTYTTGLASNKTQLVSGIMEGSRFGLRGNEDIGGGYRALFVLEHRAEINNGTGSSRPPSGTQTPDRLNQAALLGLPGALQPAVSGVAAGIGGTLGVNLGGTFWDRQAFVGLVTPFGAVIAGRQYTPAYETFAAFDTLGTQSSLSAGQVASIPSSVTIRANNALQYRIVLGGLTASAMYALGSVPGNAAAGRLGGVMATYTMGGLKVGAGYNKINNDLGLASLTSTVVGASYDIGPGKISGMVVTYKDDNPSGVSGITASLTPLAGVGGAALVQAAFTSALRQDAQMLHVGYKMTTGPNTFYVAYSAANDKRAPNADVASYGVAYTYALSKRTDLNAVLTHFNNKNLAQAAPGQAGFLGGVTRSAGVDSNNAAFGIRHRF